jgi:hypothetical protein
VAGTRICLAGHRMPGGADLVCPACRADQVIDRVAALETSLSKQDVAAAVEVVVAAAHHAVWRSLAAALESTRKRSPRARHLRSDGWSPS